jgi:hypothetical protein
MFCSLALAAALLLAPGPSASDGEPAAAGPEESAKKVVETFSGTWAGTLTITRSGRPPVQLPATWTCRKIAGGTAVDCGLRATTPSGAVIEENDLWGYDRDSRSVRLMRWTRSGDVQEHHGHWSDQQTITFTVGAPHPATLALSFPTARTAVLSYDGPGTDGPLRLDGALTRRAR